MNQNNPQVSTIRALYLVIVISMAVSGGGVKLLNAQSASAHTFVSRFYSWYVPQALQDRAEPTWHIALQQKRTEFDPQLVRLLQADAAAQDKCEDLVGLDFDPFLNSQDPAQKYDVGEIKQEGSIYIAEIYSVQAGRRSSKPDVSASFERRDGRWMFVNFCYPKGGDLVAILKAPKLPCSSPRPVRK